MKTEEQKKLEGTNRKDRDKKTIVAALEKVPLLPRFLKDVATDRQVKIYKFTCKMLVEAGALTKLDTVAVFNYAVALDVYLCAVEALNKNGAVQVYKSKATALSGYMNAYNSSFNALNKQENNLGLNIYKRERIKTFLESDQEEEASIFDKLLMEMNE
ncbi:MAG: P27 family phage terminase small subunit [Flavobacteriaceae bacterium]